MKDRVVKSMGIVTLIASDHLTLSSAQAQDVYYESQGLFCVCFSRIKKGESRGYCHHFGEGN
jgi:hypothetical protein